MTDPSHSDDDWAELTRELERDAPPPRNPELLAEDTDEEPAGDEEFSETEPGDSAESEEPAESETSPPDGETVPGEGQPGTGRKRRRRRRRRRRGGAAQTAEAAEGMPAEAEEGAEPAADETEEPEPAPAAVDAEGGDGEVEPEFAGVGGDEGEDAGGDLLRELIATWNVPSWDEIVGGLYRPDR